jgi:RNA polymerase sigma factor (sigma-70 family)
MLNESLRKQLDDWILTVTPQAVIFARSLIRNPSDAEDVVQESLLRLIRHAEEYDLINDGAKILFRTITNLCINKSQREKALYSMDLEISEDGPIPLQDRFALLPESILQERELQKAINSGMEKLPELQRAALELRALGQTKAQIATILQISESNAGVLVYRARQFLLQEVAPLLPDGFGQETPKKM